jgi:hypothetical protein
MIKEHAHKTMPARKKKSRMWKYNISILLVGLVIVISLVNILNLTNIGSSVEEQIKLYQEEARPARIEVVKIVDSSCEACYDIETALSVIKQSPVNVTRETVVEISDAGQLIGAYEIERVPTLVITGEINKSNVGAIWSQWGELRNGAFVFTKQLPPYVDTAENKTVGLVSLVRITDPSCSDCFNLSGFVKQLKTSGIVVSEEKTLE